MYKSDVEAADAFLEKFNILKAEISKKIIGQEDVTDQVLISKFTRIKHFTGFPKNSIDYCLKESNITLNDVDYICLNYNKNYKGKRSTDSETRTHNPRIRSPMRYPIAPRRLILKSFTLQLSFKTDMIKLID